MQRLWDFLRTGFYIVVFSAGLAAVLVIAGTQGGVSGIPPSVSTIDEAMVYFVPMFLGFVVASIGIVWYHRKTR